MKTEEYTTLTEKQYYYQTGSSRINKVSDFITVIKEFSKPKYKSFYFRGVNNAKYKMYNSAQRNYKLQSKYKSQEDYPKFIHDNIVSVQNWRNGKLKNKLNEIGIIESNVMSYLSLLQHSGEPTPCLDFSVNPAIAAYFMLSSINEIHEDGIDEYCSLYAFDSNIPQFKFDVAKIVNKGAIEKGIKDKNRINREYLGILFNLATKQDLIINLTLSKDFMANNTMRIIAQKGRLILNTSYNKPLETVIKDIHKDHDFTFLKCLNFHKSIKNEALEYINDLGYNKETLYLK